MNLKAILPAESKVSTFSAVRASIPIARAPQRSTSVDVGPQSCVQTMKRVCARWCHTVSACMVKATPSAFARSTAFSGSLHSAANVSRINAMSVGSWRDSDRPAWTNGSSMTLNLAAMRGLYSAVRLASVRREVAMTLSLSTSL